MNCRTSLASLSPAGLRQGLGSARVVNEVYAMCVSPAGLCWSSHFSVLLVEIEEWLQYAMRGVDTLNRLLRELK